MNFSKLSISALVFAGACATQAPAPVVADRDPAANPDPASFVCKQAFEYFTGVRFPEVNETANALAQRLENSVLANNAYMVKWTKPNNAPKKWGPFHKKGNTLVVGVKASQAEEWFRKVGRNTIGLMVTDIPENNPGTAGLRLGDEIWDYNTIRGGGSPDSTLSTFRNGGTYTEATFEVTPAQMAELKRFVRTRGRQGIISDGTVRGYPEGTPITPEFDSSSFTMRKESCSGACTSPFDYRWLDHYDHGDALKRVAASLKIAPNYVAKFNIWANFLNPNASAITIFGIDNSSRGLADNFMRNNSWGYVRGLAQWGVIPDAADGMSGQTVTERFTLADWNRR